MMSSSGKAWPAQEGRGLHAVITGMGAGNNHLGMVESASATQEIAMGASFRGYPMGPQQWTWLNAMATSTRQGDVEEVRALKTSSIPQAHRDHLIQIPDRTHLGRLGPEQPHSRGHGHEGGGFPPTLNYRHPDPEIDLHGSRLLIAPEPLDWKVRDGQAKKASGQRLRVWRFQLRCAGRTGHG